MPPNGWTDLREGMTMAQVSALLGEPMRTELDHGLTFWGYSTNPSFRSPRVVFDRMGFLDCWMIPFAESSGGRGPLPNAARRGAE